jgi:hypothetical protein
MGEKVVHREERLPGRMTLYSAGGEQPLGNDLVGEAFMSYALGKPLEIIGRKFIGLIATKVAGEIDGVVAPILEGSAEKGLTKFQTASLRISQTLETNAEMKTLRKLKSSIEKNGMIYDLPFAEQMHVFQYKGVNYLVNGHHRLAVTIKLGINEVNAAVIDATYLKAQYWVTPERLVTLSNQANSIGNKLRWY